MVTIRQFIRKGSIASADKIFPMSVAPPKSTFIQNVKDVATGRAFAEASGGKGVSLVAPFSRASGVGTAFRGVRNIYQRALGNPLAGGFKAFGGRVLGRAVGAGATIEGANLIQSSISGTPYSPAITSPRKFKGVLGFGLGGITGLAVGTGIGGTKRVVKGARDVFTDVFTGEPPTSSPFVTFKDFTSPTIPDLSISPEISSTGSPFPAMGGSVALPDISPSISVSAGGGGGIPPELLFLLLAGGAGYLLGRRKRKKKKRKKKKRKN